MTIPVSNIHAHSFLFTQVRACPVHIGGHMICLFKHVSMDGDSNSLEVKRLVWIEVVFECKRSSMDVALVDQHWMWVLPIQRPSLAQFNTIQYKCMLFNWFVIYSIFHRILVAQSHQLVCGHTTQQNLKLYSSWDVKQKSINDAACKRTKLTLLLAIVTNFQVKADQEGHCYITPTISCKISCEHCAS